MVYSKNETTCFGLYWPSSGFYNIKEESIKAVKTVRGCRLRDLYISPLTTLFLVQELFVNMEKFIHREKSTRRCGDGGILLGAAYAYAYGWMDGWMELRLVLSSLLILFDYRPKNDPVSVSCCARAWFVISKLNRYYRRLVSKALVNSWPLHVRMYCIIVTFASVFQA